MWPFRKKKIGQRRLEVRKNIPATETGFLQRLRDSGGMTSVLLALALFVGVLAMDIWPLDPLPWRVGQYVPEDIHARVDLRVVSRERLYDRQQEEAELRPASFRLDGKLVQRVLDDLRKLPGRLQATTQPADVAPDLQTRFGLKGASASQALAAWRAYVDETKRSELERQITWLGEAFADTYIVEADKIDAQWGRESVVLVSGDYRQPVRLTRLISPDQTDPVAREARRLAARFNDPFVRSSVGVYLADVLGRSPTYIYDSEATWVDRQKMFQELAADPPRDCYDLYYDAGGLLVPASRAQNGQPSMGLTAQELNLLRREQYAYDATTGRDRPWSVLGRIITRGGIVLLLALVLCFYVVFYQKRIVTNHWRALAMVCTMLLMLAAGKGLLSIPWVNPHVCVLPVVMVAVIVTIAYDQRFALGVGLIIAALAVLQLRGDFEMFFLLVVAVAAAVFQLDEIRTRSKLIRVLGVSAAVTFAAAWCWGLFNGTPAKFVLSDSLWAGVPTLFVGFLVQGVLPVIEGAFRIATSMTLLEWCDASKPLMRRLAMEAPGTHNHSLQLGSMCEAAAEAIGANGLLGRVGAYYHDIGKINKAEYFVENQAGSASKHAKLSPAMSLLIIIGHVKDGVELAREYALPKVLREFIETHHGTTLVQYFYHAAAEQRKDDADRAPDEVEFRYPGPKPGSKEAAILMLADAAESSVRSMTEPTPGRIENQVHAVVSRRLMDGQLDSCLLTLREVHSIEQSLIKSLCGIYHSRIAYPTPPGEKPSAAERRPKANGQKPPPAEQPPAADAPTEADESPEDVEQSS